MIGANQIGSSIHVAGHPLLLRDQQILLTLVNDKLYFYDFDNPTPIDSLPLNNLQTIHTVIYDEDRIPHTDVIDSTAQALQLTFLWRDKTCTCLFRQMRKIRPIDWYHAIQQSRLELDNYHP